MGLLLLRFWPVLIPLLIYWLWLYKVGRKATIEGVPVLRFRDGPWYWMVIASLLTAVACFVAMGAAIENDKGTYIPPHMEGGKLVPSQVAP